MSSIHQIIEVVLSNFTPERLASLGLETFLREGMEKCQQEILAYASSMLQEVDVTILTHPHLRRGWVVKDGPRPRTLETRYGTLHFTRRYYEHKKDGRKCYLLDQVLDLEPYSRVEGGLGAHLVELATEHSFAEAAALGSGKRVTKQTVSNLCRKVKLPKQRFSCRKQEGIKELHLQVDEDHIRHQAPFKKKRGTVDMVVLHEPKQPVGKSKTRYALQETITFLHPGGESHRLWDRVAEQFYERYGSPKNYRVFLHGDGGAWIKRGLDYFPDAVMILDEFHLKQKIHGLCGKKTVVKERIWRSLQREGFVGVEEELELCVANGLCREEEKVEFMGYVKGQEEGIRNGFLYKEDHGGSCAEAQVRHRLSERFSTRGRSWSSGLLSMVACREYLLNGGKITGKDIYAAKEELEEEKILLAGSVAKVVGKKGSAAYAQTTSILGSQRRGSAEATIHKALLRQGMLQ